MNESPPRHLVRCQSHRSMAKLHAMIGKTQAYFTMKRDGDGHKGVYAVTDEQLATIRKAKLKGVSRIREPYDHWQECWSWT